MKPKILIFVPSPNEVQRFVLGQAFVRLERHFQVIYVLPEADHEKMIPLMEGIAGDAEIRFINIEPARVKTWSRMFKMACYQYADKSRSFALRINAARYSGNSGKKQLVLDRMQYSKPSGLHAFLDKVKSKFGLADASNKAFANAGKMRMFDKEVFDSFCQKTLSELGPNQEMDALFEDISPIATIIPSSLLDVFCNDVIWTANKYDCASIVLQSGWDNLSSKGILHHKPTFLGVWGKQSRTHAIEIQEMDDSSLVDLGAPHYEALVSSTDTERTELRQRLGVSPDESLIMFGGAFRQFDETQTLRDLDAHIENTGLKCKILYRPHPYRLDREGEDDFFQIDWKHIVFDEEMLERYRLSKENAGYIKRERPLYSMDNLTKVISAVDAVISPMSTLLLEAMILGKPSMAVAFSDDTHTYSAATASEMTHFDILKNRDKALIWCTDNRKFLTDVERLIARKNNASMQSTQKSIIGKVVKLEPGKYADRLFSFVADTVVPKALNKKKLNFDKKSTISHYYSADQILKDYVGIPKLQIHVPGYWMHGWLPKYFNRHYGLIALHKKLGPKAADRQTAHEVEKQNEFQWVSRQDQADFLIENGYKKVKAIGLPFTYLPTVNVTKRPNSLLVMPPHGRREYFRGSAHGEAYVQSILELRNSFSEIMVCITERDYARGEWRALFQDADIPVIIGANHFDGNPLLRLKETLSSFEYVTTNAFGSHIAYAAHCGVKVSIYGPYCEWPKEKKTYASKLFPLLGRELVDLMSETNLRAEYPFLFTHPAKATTMTKWGNQEIGMDFRKSPSNVQSLFGQ